MQDIHPAASYLYELSMDRWDMGNQGRLIGDLSI